MSILKSVIDNVEKICKYISFGTFLLAVFIGSFVICNNNIKNVYAIIGVYACCLFISRVVNVIGKFVLQLFSHILCNSSKSLSKMWTNLSDAERIMLIEMYHSENKSLKLEMTNRTVLLLEQRNLIMRPTQCSDGFTAVYIMQGNAEKMIKENWDESEDR